MIESGAVGHRSYSTVPFLLIGLNLICPSRSLLIKSILKRFRKRSLGTGKTMGLRIEERKKNGQQRI
jgi:hypothetical protein